MKISPDMNAAFRLPVRYFVNKNVLNPDKIKVLIQMYVFSSLASLLAFGDNGRERQWS
jgi:hypothetical protein